MPALAKLRTGMVTIGPDVTSVPGQVVLVRGLLGDVTSDGLVSGNDRSPDGHRDQRGGTLDTPLPP